MNLIKLAYRNIIAQPLNLLLSIILFALGIGLISFLLLVNTQMKEKFDANLADIHMVVGAKGSPLQMILSSMYHIDAPTGNITIKEAIPFLREGHPLIEKSVPLSLGDSYKTYRVVGTDHNILDFYNAKLEDGRLWEEAMETTIGKVVAEETGLKIGDTFASSHGFRDDETLVHDEVPFKVVGILEGSGTVLDLLILTPSSSAWVTHDHDHEEEDSSSDDSLDSDQYDHEHEHSHDGENHDHDHGEDGDHDHQHSHGEGDHDHDHDDHDNHEGHFHTNDRAELLTYGDKDITSILVRFKNNKNFQALNMPRNINENTDLQAATPAYEMNRLYAMIGTGTDAIRSLAILIAIVSAISIFIFLFKSLRERRYELALMRVMGAGPEKLFFLIIMEGIILALIGFIIGIVLSHLSMEILAGYLKADYRYSFSGWRWLNEEWILLVVSLVIGLLAALIPAINARNTDINKTLSNS